MDASDLPSVAAEPERYAGRPLLAVLENYVLDCLGELSPDKQAKIRFLVQGIWGGGDDWKATLRSQLQLEASLDETIRALWLRNKELAQPAKIDLQPIPFARAFVDQNFAQLF